jgi:hypothetical protein
MLVAEGHQVGITIRPADFDRLDQPAATHDD